MYSLLKKGPRSSFVTFYIKRLKKALKWAASLDAVKYPIEDPKRLEVLLFNTKDTI